MKKASLIAALLLAGSAAFAQDDPTIMVINGVPVARSEFEYSYNKNNADGVIDKKSVEEYVDLFVNYKLKVAAALDAKLDTLSSFKKEYAQYRDQQVRPTMVTDADVEAEARNIYDKTKASIGDKGLIHPAHIFLAVGQKATAGQQDTAKQRIDSIYAALKGGADFAEMAKQLSQDKATAQAGGQFDDVAFALKVGEMSEPFLSPAGYHIVLMKGRKQLEPYDSLRANIMRFIEQRNLRDNIAETKLDMEVRRSGGKLTREQEDFVQAATVHQAMDAIFPRPLQPLLRDAANRISYERDIMPHISCYPGLHDVLDFCRSAGLTLAMNTNRTDGMSLLLDNCRLHGYFDPIVLASDVARPKPDPEGALLILRQWHSLPEQVLFIGDSASDKGAAEGAGIPFLCFQTEGLASQSVSDFSTLLHAMKMNGEAHSPALQRKIYSLHNGN